MNQLNAAIDWLDDWTDWIYHHNGTTSIVILLVASTLDYRFNFLSISIDTQAFLLLLVLLDQTGWLQKMGEQLKEWILQITDEFNRQVFEQQYVLNRRRLPLRYYYEAMVEAFYR